MPIGQAQGTKITWDDTADKKLLMAMLKVASPSVPSFQEVAQVFGEGATAKALTNRWGKLKQQIEGSSAQKTPAKAKASTKPKAPPTSKGATKRKVMEGVTSDEDNEDDEESEVKPAKKVKVEKKSPEEDGEDWLV
ncbi:hypothetical protein Slin15195_G048840 [Septoria linicola]|uniref:Uncharacterized protein n=1 Tax=Septoria linicola TaxID=215465 RepID=A0A9Q9AS58_9PEZI|nr:hypothetical protein Slin15195_G048840 [Septoria linicola]